MKKMNKKMVTMVMLVFMLVIAAVPVSAASLKLSEKSATLKTGQSITLQVKGSKKKAKWETSNKKVATVNQKGKVTAKKAGKATITAKIGNKKLTCKVTVVTEKKTTAPSNNSDASNNNSDTSISTVVITPNPVMYYKGQKTDNGIAYNDLFTKNGLLYVQIVRNIKNASDSNIDLSKMLVIKSDLLCMSLDYIIKSKYKF